MEMYVYGIIDSSKQIDESIYGLKGAIIYNIPYCDIGVVVSEMNQPIQDATKKAALEHEAVVERLMANFTILPFRFMTIIGGRNNVLSMMQSYYEDFKDNLKRLQNKLEFGIKVIWPADRIKESIVCILKKRKQHMLASDDSPGKKFVKGKFEKYRIEKEFKEKAGRVTKVIDIFLSRFAAEKRLEELKTENLLLDAVYLVEKDKKNDFKEAFEHMKSAHSAFRYLFSGPWPPYSFVILPDKLRLHKGSKQLNVFDKAAQYQDSV